MRCSGVRVRARLRAWDMGTPAHCGAARYMPIVICAAPDKASKAWPLVGREVSRKAHGLHEVLPGKAERCRPVCVRNALGGSMPGPRHAPGFGPAPRSGCDLPSRLAPRRIASLPRAPYLCHNGRDGKRLHLMQPPRAPHLGHHGGDGEVVVVVDAVQRLARLSTAWAQHGHSMGAAR